MTCPGCPAPDPAACAGTRAPRICELAADPGAYREWVAAGCPLQSGPAPPPRPAPAVTPPPPGPGAVLHRWLASEAAVRLGFGPAEGCGCASDAAAMDAAGPDGVLADLDAWTAKIAAKPQAAKVSPRLIRWAIRLACLHSRRSRGSVRPDTNPEGAAP